MRYSTLMFFRKSGINMKVNFQKFLLVTAIVSICVDSLPQETTKVLEKNLIDSLSAKGLLMKPVQEKPDIQLNNDQSVRYLQSMYKLNNWKNPDDPLRKAIGQLLFYVTNTPYDSTRYFLNNYSFDSISIPWDRFYTWDTLKIQKSVVPSEIISLPSDTVMKADSTVKWNPSDSLKTVKKKNFFDTLPVNTRVLAIMKDSLMIVAVDTLSEVVSKDGNLPFRYYYWLYENDSIKVAVSSLIKDLDNRDSMIVNITGTSREVLPVWLNSKNDKLARFWLRNETSDSVTVWIGGVSRNTLGLFLEDGIFFRRPTKESKFSDAQLNLKKINSNNLREVNRSAVKPHFWKLHSESSFIFNQTALTNWVRGGENSLTLASDITGFADYNNKKINLSSNNFIRLKYGVLKSGENPVRKNVDLLETNSKLNHKAFGKFDFSAILLFKTQIAKGYNYPNDSIPVSKFLNPAVVTLGLGLDYKPNKTTSINFSPFTYKGTFMTDTGKLIGQIDQTKYGIPANRKSMHEPGVSLLITNEFKPYKTITITNRMQLFTNYIHNPQNIDVDWEMIASAKLNWFTDVRFNTHLVFDDDTKTVVLDKNKKPVLDADGKQRKTARIQFKELLGFSIFFRF
jgi:hypothetical protein